MASYIDLGAGKFKLYVELGYDASGKRKRRTKVVEASGPRAAAKLLSAFEQDVYNNQHIEVDNAGFADFVDRWTRNYMLIELEPSTQEVYEGILLHIVPHFQRLKLKEIKTIHVIDYFRSEKAAGRGSLEKKFNILKSIFRHAVLWKMLVINPMDGVPKPRAKKRKIEFYDKEELGVLMPLLNSLPDNQRLMAKMALFGGLRRGEVMGVAVDMVDFKKKQIKIIRSLQYSANYGFRLKGTKTENVRTVTFPNSFMQELQDHYANTMLLKKEMGNLWEGFKDIYGKEVHLLFTNEYGVPNTPNSLTRSWVDFMKQNKDKIKRIRFQDLRHSSASLLLSEGINMKILQKRLGHSDIKTTLSVYSHITEKDDEKASDVFNDFSHFE